MDYKKYLLNELLDKYENSQLFVKGVGKRRILYKPNEDTTLKKKMQNVSEKRQFLSDVLFLKKTMLIDFIWEKYEEDNIIKEIWLLTENESLSQSYGLVKRVPLDRQQNEITKTLAEARNQIEDPLLIELVNQILSEALEKGRSWHPPIKGIPLVNVLKVFYFLDSLNETVTTRILSIQLFSDSKFFETHVQRDILRLLSRYLFQNIDTEMSDKEKLKQIHIGASPELFYFCGNAKINYTKNQALDISIFPKGFNLTENYLENILTISGQFQTIVTIENLTNYYWYVKRKFDGTQLIFYTGGFLSPSQQKLLKKVELNSVETISHWGDIDLGGFRILHQIKRIFPDVKPLRMDVETFMKYEEQRKQVPKEYLQKVEQLRRQEDMKDYREVLGKILEYEEILEQEAELTI